MYCDSKGNRIRYFQIIDYDKYTQKTAKFRLLLLVRGERVTKTLLLTIRKLKYQIIPTYRTAISGRNLDGILWEDACSLFHFGQVNDDNR